MKKITFLLLLFGLTPIISFGQQLQPVKKVTIAPADTSSYSIIENPDGIDVHNDLKIREKISFYRKEEVDFLLDFGDGLKILIYKEEE